MNEFLQVDASLVADFTGEVEEMLGAQETAIITLEPFAHTANTYDMG